MNDPQLLSELSYDPTLWLKLATFDTLHECYPLVWGEEHSASYPIIAVSDCYTLRFDRHFNAIDMSSCPARSFEVFLFGLNVLHFLHNLFLQSSQYGLGEKIKKLYFYLPQKSGKRQFLNLSSFHYNQVTLDYNFCPWIWRHFFLLSCLCLILHQLI